jgi:tRNA(Ile)-lysidine synthase
MNRLAEDVAELSEYMGWQVQQILRQHMVRQETGDVLLPVAALEDHPGVLKRRILLELLAEASGSRKDIGREHASALLDLAEGRVGRSVNLPYGLRAEKTYGQIRIVPVNAALNHKRVMEKCLCVRPGRPAGEWQGTIEGMGIGFACRIFPYMGKNGEIPKKQYTKWFDYDKIKGGLYLRTREPGDFFYLTPEGRRQKVKDYWMNEKVPREVRSQTLLLAEGSHILWIVGGRISAYYKITEETRNVLEVTVKM